MSGKKMNSQMATGFSIMADADAPPSHDKLIDAPICDVQLAHVRSEDVRPDVLDNHDIRVEDIVAAILSDKHALSAEDLKAFEKLLDDRNASKADTQEYLQIIWNIVVGIIDHKWDYMRRSDLSSAPKNSCGQKRKDASPSGIEDQNMLNSEDQKLSQTYKKAAGK